MAVLIAPGNCVGCRPSSGCQRGRDLVHGSPRLGIATSVARRAITRRRCSARRPCCCSTRISTVDRHCAGAAVLVWLLREPLVALLHDRLSAVAQSRFTDRGMAVFHISMQAGNQRIRTPRLQEQFWPMVITAFLYGASTDWRLLIGFYRHAAALVRPARCARLLDWAATGRSRHRTISLAWLAAASCHAGLHNRRKKRPVIPALITASGVGLSGRLTVAPRCVLRGRMAGEQRQHPARGPFNGECLHLLRQLARIWPPSRATR